MEIKLKFKEKEFRDLYENSYEFVRGELKNKINQRNKTRNILLILSVVTFLLTFFHKDWMYYGWTLLIIAVFFITWTEILKIKTKRFIQRNRKEVDDFVNKTKSTSDIKYSYDDHNIRYCESGEVIDAYPWNDLERLEDSIECFILHFRSNKPTIMIPRTMVEDEEELIKFERKINEVLENAR